MTFHGRIGVATEIVAREALLVLILRWPEKATGVIAWAAGLSAKGTVWTATVRQMVAERKAVGG